jgi:hypothetical protein
MSASVRLLVPVIAVLVFTGAEAHPGSSIAVDRHGSVFFADTLKGVWRIDSKGALTFVGPPNFHFFALDEDNRFARFARRSSRDEIRPIGEVSSPTVIESSDFPVAIHGGGLYFAPGEEGKPLPIVRAAPDGTMTTLATLPGVGWLNGIAARPDGTVYGTVDTGIVRLSPSRELGWFARDVTVPDCHPLSGLEDEAAPPYLRGLAVAADGTVYVAATGCRSVAKIAPTGAVTTILSAEGSWSPTAVAVAGGAVYVLEYDHSAGERVWPPRVRKVDPAGKVTLLARVTR